MPEVQRALTEHARALTVAQAKSLIGFTLEKPHWFSHLTVNWRKSGNRTLDAIEDLDRLYSPNTVATIESHVSYKDRSNITLVLGFPHITAVAKPAEGNYASQTLRRIQLELDRMSAPTLKPRIFDASFMVTMATYLIIFFGSVILLNKLTDWNVIVNSILAVLIGYSTAFPLQKLYNRHHPPFRTWVSHHEIPERIWTRGELIAVITLIATIVGVIISALVWMLS